MTKRQRAILLFRFIAEGFNLEEYEVEETVKLPLEKLTERIQECFRQIEDPEKIFNESDYKFLTEILGCVNLKEQLLNSQPDNERTAERAVIHVICTIFPEQFTFSQMMIEVRSWLGITKEDLEVEGTVKMVLSMLAHKNVKILITEDNETYKVNQTTKVKGL